MENSVDTQTPQERLTCVHVSNTHQHTGYGLALTQLLLAADEPVHLRQVGACSLCAVVGVPLTLRQTVHKTIPVCWLVVEACGGGWALECVNTQARRASTGASVTSREGCHSCSSATRAQGQAEQN